jgi:ribosomal protein L24E
MNCATCGANCDQPISVYNAKKRKVFHFCSGDCEVMFSAQDKPTTS